MEKIKTGDIVILDKKYNNSIDVKVVSCREFFSTVQAVDGAGEPWDVMTNRLSKKNINHELFQKKTSKS